MNKVGLIKYVNLDFEAFYLDKAARYGIFMTSRFVIIYFEFDTDAPWDETTGSSNDLNSVIEDAFRLNGVKLISWYFDYQDASFLVIDHLGYVYQIVPTLTYNEDNTSIE